MLAYQPPPPMHIKWTKLFFRLLGFELLTKEFVKLLALGLYSFTAEIKKRLIVWAIKVVILLVLLALLVQGTLLFGLGALALYFNALLGSNFQGFLVVSGGCAVLLLLLWLLSRVRWPRHGWRSNCSISCPTFFLASLVSKTIKKTLCTATFMRKEVVFSHAW